MRSRLRRRIKIYRAGSTTIGRHAAGPCAPTWESIIARQSANLHIQRPRRRPGRACPDDQTYEVTVSYQITVTRDFSASHQIRIYDGSLEPLHGHNWRVVVTVEAAKLDSIGVVMDFHELRRLLDGIVHPFHNHHLNDLPPFQARNPTAENVAAHVAEALGVPAGVRLVCVEAWETPDCRARWLP
jgi:6-pyruvoyltetrahydropterin/6-carboxytetrahydropterin synthase